MPDMVERPDIVRDTPQVPHNHSNFDLKEVRMTTELFGLVKPHMIFDDVSSDDLDYRPQYKTRSYSLKAPLMQDVHRKLSYVKCDLSAILPFNFEKFYTNPVNGDDVPDRVSPEIPNGYDFIAKAVKEVLDDFVVSFDGVGNFTAANLTGALKSLVFGELFYSRGCLLSSLGCHLAKQFSCTISQLQPIFYSYDQMFDQFIIKMIGVFNSANCPVITVRFGSTTKIVAVTGAPNIWSKSAISFREMLAEIRSSADWDILYFGTASSPVTITSDIGFTPSWNFVYSADVPFNFGRCCAYQLSVAEYMTNDKVDHIYSAELYRQYVGSLIKSYRSNNGRSDFLFFTYNGVSYQYDYLSGIYLADLLSDLSVSSSFFNLSCQEYFISLFGYKRSLRYKDYFVSSRVRPLAVGNVDVTVNSNLVSVIDITKKIQVQRFLNAVNHSGRRLSNYIKTFFGINISPDRHVPHWLADIDELVYTSEVENTGAAQQTNQNSVTATFTGNSGNKQLHFYADLPGYIIGLTSYDIERAYPDTIDRSFFIENRFDMFIPEMQFVGDQPVYAQEINSADTRAYGTAFGYQYRDMQYKLFYSVADGGFVENLPGYGFLFDGVKFDNPNVSPDFIRAKSSELDEFFLSLTGYSLGSYFHFISIITNNFSAKRPMIANPKILE